MRDYGESAQEIGRAAEELRRATVELGALLSSDAALVEDASRAIRSVVDRVVLGGVLLVLAVGGGVLGYRVAAARLARRA